MNESVLLIVALLPTLIAILYILWKLYDRYNNPQKYIQTKFDNKDLKQTSDEVFHTKKVLKHTGKLNKVAFKKALLDWKRDKSLAWTKNEPYPKPKKKNFYQKLS